MRELFRGQAGVDGAFFEQLRELLVLADVGLKSSEALISELKRRLAGAEALSEESVLDELKTIIRELLRASEGAAISPTRVDGRPRVVAVVGENGAGKTTTIGKLAQQLKLEGAQVLIGACDTFRAAAAEQMEIWAERAGVEIVRGEENAKPATVAYRAVHEAIDKGYDVVLLDTAGRLHTRTNLMNELAAVMQLVARELPGAPHETLLVVDASTGQNGLAQAREFSAKVPLSGLIVTKLDGTPKGGIVVAIKQELGIPVRYIGVGEGLCDLKHFDAAEFVEALFANEAPVEVATERGEVRRRRRAENG